MQPAELELVQILTVPASAATASAFRGAMMSLPWCGPCGRGAPKSFVYCTRPTTGNTIRLAVTRADGVVVGLGVAGFGLVIGPVPPSASPEFPGCAEATPAERPSSRRRRETPRAVVRWRRIKLRFALEGPNPSRGFGSVSCRLRADLTLEQDG